MLGLGGLALALGSFLPWVTIFAFNISGNNARYGFVALLGGVAALVVGYQVFKGGLFTKEHTNNLIVLTLVLAVLALAAALYVGFAVRDSVAAAKATGGASSVDVGGDTPFEREFEKSMREFERTLTKAFGPRVGYGIWVTIVGALLSIAGSIHYLKGQPGPSAPSAEPAPPGPPAPSAPPPA